MVFPTVRSGRLAAFGSIVLIGLAGCGGSGGGGGNGPILPTAQTFTAPASTSTSTLPIVPCSQFLTSFIRFGANNDTDQVTRLQNFLNLFEGNKLTVDFDKAGEKRVIDQFVQKA